MDLVVDNLGVARGGVTVLEGVSFRLAPGAALVLRGANGIGKTTLLRCLAGLQPAISGTVTGPELAYGAHADGLKAMLTVGENLAFWASVYGGRVGDALTAMNLVALVDRRAADLSAGQKRRLGLARMMVTGRQVWLLDEPTVSLDTASVGLFQAMLRAHLGQGGSAVIATHIDLGVPAAVLDLSGFRAVQRSDGAFDGAFL
ncbi:MAG: heme ABC exporter ATP-binding protein CcmA [Pseudorhodobacter sp.]|nr:heme ABC exporter ATP-binding protein CcmA [Pseudorhodobacter sp.]